MRSLLNRTGAYACAAIVFGLAGAAGAASFLPVVATATTASPDVSFPCNSPTPCVSGVNNAGGAGVKGSSNTGIGVIGTTTKGAGIEGVSGNGALGGVEGIGTSGFGLFGKSSSGVGTHSQSSSNYGLEAISATNYAVHAVNTTSGAAIGALANSGNAIYASVANGIGITATASTGIGAYFTGPTGVVAQSPASGVPIDARDFANRDVFFVNGIGNVVSGAISGTGLDSSSASGWGAWLHSGNGDGAHITSANANGADITGAAYGVVARAPAGSSGDPFVATDTPGNILFYVDGSGNVYYHGSLINFAKIRSGQQAMAFGSTTTTPTLEDVGTAQLVDGQALVRLDSTFAQAIDLRAPYHVFLTPNGDTRGLYVASKSPDGFVVRETQNGRGTLAFDYRVVASSLGHAGERMAPITPDQARTIPKAPPARPRVAPPPKTFIVSPRPGN